jgi:hypothetical protein
LTLVCKNPQHALKPTPLSLQQNENNLQIRKRFGATHRHYRCSAVHAGNSAGAGVTSQSTKWHAAALRLSQSNAREIIPSKVTSPDGTLDDGEFLNWSFNSTGGGGSAAREDSGGNPGARLRISTSATSGTDTVTAIKADFTTTIPFEGDTFTFSVDS